MATTIQRRFSSWVVRVDAADRRTALPKSRGSCSQQYDFVGRRTAPVYRQAPEPRRQPRSRTCGTLTAIMKH